MKPCVIFDLDGTLADHYVIQHRLKDSLQHEKNVLAMVLDDSVDDLAGVLEPQDFDRVKEYNNAVWTNIRQTAKDVEWVVAHSSMGAESRKDSAIVIKDRMPELMGVCFQVLDGKPCLNVVVDHMKKQLKSQSSVDKIRHLIGTEWEY